MSVYELSTREIYDSFASGIDPTELLAESRTDLATRLQIREGLKQEEAYYAADQLRAYALEMTQSGDTA